MKNWCSPVWVNTKYVIITSTMVGVLWALWKTIPTHKCRRFFRRMLLIVTCFWTSPQPPSYTFLEECSTNPAEQLKRRRIHITKQGNLGGNWVYNEKISNRAHQWFNCTNYWMFLFDFNTFHSQRSLSKWLQTWTQHHRIKPFTGICAS